MLPVEYEQKPVVFINCIGLVDCFSKNLLGQTASYKELDKIITHCCVLSMFIIFLK